jgi:hypothetical protein
VGDFDFTFDYLEDSSSYQIGQIVAIIYVFMMVFVLLNMYG